MRHSHDCKTFRERVATLLDSDRTRPDASLMDHARSCSECRNHYEQLQVAENLMQKLASSALPAPAESLHARIMERVAAHPHPSRALGDYTLWWGVAAVLAIAIGVGALQTLGSHERRIPQIASVATPLPAVFPEVPQETDTVDSFTHRLKEATTPEIIRTSREDFSWLATTILSTAEGAAMSVIPEEVLKENS